jgi:hypothetical protein
MQAATQIWSPAIGATEKWYARCMPCLTDLAFLLPVFFLFGRLPGTRILFGDSDTGWHIRTGEWILAHRIVPNHDLFSFTKSNQIWCAWEWGWDLLFGIIHKFWGLEGVAFVNVIVLGIVSVLVYKLALRASGNELASFFVAAVATCGSSVHWLARPHLTSWLLFLLFLHLIRDLQEGRRRPFYLLPVIAAIWANIHPSCFLGVLLLLLTAAEEALQLFIEGRTWPAIYEKCRPFLWTIASCSLASLLNPYSWRLYGHIFVFLHSEAVDGIQEYQSVNFHNPPAGFFECMLLLAAASVFWSLRTRTTNATISVLFWAHVALFSVRNVPLFLMIAAPLVAKMLNHLVTGTKIPRLSSIYATITQMSQDIRLFERRKHLHALSAFATLALAVLFASGARGFEGQFPSGVFPTTAVRCVAASSARRIFASDQWGGYLIYRLYPAKKVFVDGRADVFGSELLTIALNIQNARYDWKHQLDRFAVDMVIVKPDAPLAAELKVSPDWMTLFDDGKAIVFQAKLSRMQRVDSRTDRRS